MYLGIRKINKVPFLCTLFTQEELDKFSKPGFDPYGYHFEHQHNGAADTLLLKRALTGPKMQKINENRCKGLIAIRATYAGVKLETTHSRIPVEAKIITHDFIECKIPHFLLAPGALAKLAEKPKEPILPPVPPVKTVSALQELLLAVQVINEKLPKIKPMPKLEVMQDGTLECVLRVKGVPEWANN